MTFRGNYLKLYEVEFMDSNLFDATNKAAYFLWDTTKHGNALEVWYCAEDIGSFFERSNILTLNDLNNITDLPHSDGRYVNFIRNIAFRIFLFTDCDDHIVNWYATETLLHNGEWVTKILEMATIFRNHKTDSDFMSKIKSSSVKQYYDFGQNLP